MGDIIQIGLNILLVAGLLWTAIVNAQQWVKKMRTDAYREGYREGYTAGTEMATEALRSVRQAVIAS